MSTTNKRPSYSSTLLSHNWGGEHKCTIYFPWLDFNRLELDFREWDGNVAKTMEILIDEYPAILGGTSKDSFDNRDLVRLELVKASVRLEAYKQETRESRATPMASACIIRPVVKKVIFSKPATIVFWKDGTKTVVKCQEGDDWDSEKGITMCYVKKMLGNKGNYYNTIRKAMEMADIPSQKYGTVSLDTTGYTSLSDETKEMVDRINRGLKAMREWMTKIDTAYSNKEEDTHAE